MIGASLDNDKVCKKLDRIMSHIDRSYGQITREEQNWLCDTIKFMLHKLQEAEVGVENLK